MKCILIYIYIYIMKSIMKAIQYGNTIRIKSLERAGLSSRSDTAICDIGWSQQVVTVMTYKLHRLKKLAFECYGINLLQYPYPFITVSYQTGVLAFQICCWYSLPLKQWRYLPSGQQIAVSSVAIKGCSYLCHEVGRKRNRLNSSTVIHIQCQ